MLYPVGDDIGIFVEIVGRPVVGLELVEDVRGFYRQSRAINTMTICAKNDTTLRPKTKLTKNNPINFIVDSFKLRAVFPLQEARYVLGVPLREVMDQSIKLKL
jgi:hypothetical protein